MAELLPPPELPVNGGTTTTTTTTVTTLTDTHLQQQQPGGLGLTTKRQRRPSVRLGEIGDQSATLSCESYRRNKLWSDTRYRLYPSQKELITSKSSSSSKTRALTNFGNGHETLEPPQDDNNKDAANLDLLGGSHKGREFKGKRGNNAKRVRSNWVVSSSKAADEGGGGVGVGVGVGVGGGGFDKFSGDEWVRDFDGDGGEDRDQSESPLKEHSPVNSLENVGGMANQDGVFTGQRRMVRARRSESRDHGAVELEGPSDNDGREWRCRTSVEGNNGRCRSLEDGVRMWLTGLGLGRYEPLFEIHEVDEEVLPLLTLEDLKDMGINAVGSRRKLYSAIQKLGRGFS